MGVFHYGNRGYINLRTGGQTEFTVPSIPLVGGLKNDLKDSLHLDVISNFAASLFEITSDSVIHRCDIPICKSAEILMHDSLDLVASLRADSTSIFICEEDTAIHVHTMRWNNEPLAYDIVSGDSVVFIRYGLTLTSWLLNDDLSLTFIDSIEFLNTFYGDLHYEFPYVGTGNLLFRLDDTYHFIDQLFIPVPQGLNYSLGIIDINDNRMATLFEDRAIGCVTIVFDLSDGTIEDTLAYVQYGDQYSALDGDTLWVASYYCLSKYILTEFNDVPGSNPWSNDTAVPITFELLPAWPNPFNSTVSIPFTLPTSCAVVVSVHDILGRQVALVADDVYPSGYNVVRFSPTSLSSGTYFATLSTPFSQQTRRLILVK